MAASERRLAEPLGTLSLLQLHAGCSLLRAGCRLSRQLPGGSPCPAPERACADLEADQGAAQR